MMLIQFQSLKFALPILPATDVSFPARWEAPNNSSGWYGSSYSSKPEAARKVRPPVSEASHSTYPSDEKLRRRCLRELRHPEPFKRCVAAEYLGEGGFQDAQVISALIRTLEDEDYEVRETAAEVLFAIGPPAWGPLLCAFGSAGQGAKEATVEYLGRIGDPRATLCLIRGLEDPAWEIRAGAALSLGMSEDPRIRPLLDAAGSDPYVNVRVSAIEALGRIGDRNILPILKKIFKETRNEEIRQAAENAVQHLELKSR